VRGQEQRQTSAWTCEAALETAAAYVAAVRTAPDAAARRRALGAGAGLVALADVFRALPLVDAPFSAGPAGDELRSWFGPARVSPLSRAPVALLRLPATRAEYLRGRSRQALRTNVTRATAAGVTCAELTDPAELRRVVEHVARGRHQDPATMVRPRPAAVRPRWSAAYDGAGDPVALSETVVDGAWAGLATLVTVHGEADGQLVRYLLHTATVGGLIDAGVRHLTVSGSMLLSAPGTRYFQRRTGYEPVWLRPVAARRPPAARIPVLPAPRVSPEEHRAPAAMARPSSG
jgi:hypothetical protein